MSLFPIHEYLLYFFKYRAYHVSAFFFPREPRKSAREQFRESVSEHFASARERLN